MDSFKIFMEAVPMSAARTIRKNFGKSYRPGQFGIEIEFHAAEEDREIDYDSARESFNRQPRPEDPREWELENPEPEKPDESDYKYDDTDPFTNYWNLDLEKEPMDKPLPDIIRKFSDTYRSHEIQNLFSNYYERAQQFIVEELGNIVYKLNRFYEGRGNNSIFESRKEFEDYFRKLEYEFGHAHPDVMLRLLGQRFNELEMTPQQHEYLKNFWDATNEAISAFVKFHKQRAESITEEEYNEKIESIYEKDNEKWEEEHEQWEEEHLAIQTKWNDWDEDDEFMNWLNHNEDQFMLKNTNVESEISDVQHWFSRMGVRIRTPSGKDSSTKEWSVFEDEEGIVEIVSPILTVGNLGFLKQLLDYLSDKEFGRDTGLHVHIGMPLLTDAFDLISMANLMDEQAVLLMANRNTQSITNYTKKKDQLFQIIYLNLNNGIYDNNVLHSNLFQDSLTRYFGVNIKSFTEQNTVEIRYLSSLIVKHPETLFKAINYFLMLPKIAHSRNQIRYDVPVYGTIILSRRPGGKVEVRKFPLGRKDRISMPQTSEPVTQLRSPTNSPTEDERKAYLMQKYGNKLQNKNNITSVSNNIP